MVGADEGIPAGPNRDEEQLLLFARMDHELGAVGVQDIGISDLDGLEERGRRQLVQLLAAVFEPQAIGSPLRKVSLFGSNPYSFPMMVTVCAFDQSGAGAAAKRSAQRSTATDVRMRVTLLRLSQRRPETSVSPVGPKASFVRLRAARPMPLPWSPILPIS